MELRRAAREALCLPDPAAKAAAATALFDACRDGAALDSAAALPPLAAGPGRPERPHLVDPARLPRRSPSASTMGLCRPGLLEKSQPSSRVTPCQ